MSESGSSNKDRKGAKWIHYKLQSLYFPGEGEDNVSFKKNNKESTEDNKRRRDQYIIETTKKQGRKRRERKNVKRQMES